MAEQKQIQLIKPFRDGERVWLGEPGTLREVFRCITDKTGSTQFRVGISVFNPGEGAPPHVHPDTEEWNYVIQGTGIQLGENGEELFTFTKGDVRFIPKGVYHGGRIIGDEPYIVLWCYPAGGELPTK
jgi:quercetin dioxygenase-like cupin family protein